MSPLSVSYSESISNGITLITIKQGQSNESMPSSEEHFMSVDVELPHFEAADFKQ